MYPLVGPLVGLCICWLVCWLDSFEWFVDLLLGLCIGWLICWLESWSVGLFDILLVGRSVCRFFSWIS